MIWIFLLLHLGPLTFIIVLLEGEWKKRGMGRLHHKDTSGEVPFWWIVQEPLCKSMKKPA